MKKQIKVNEAEAAAILIALHAKVRKPDDQFSFKAKNGDKTTLGFWHTPVTSDAKSVLTMMQSKNGVWQPMTIQCLTQDICNGIVTALSKKPTRMLKL